MPHRSRHNHRMRTLLVVGLLLGATSAHAVSNADIARLQERARDLARQVKQSKELQRLAESLRQLQMARNRETRIQLDEMLTQHLLLQQTQLKQESRRQELNKLKNLKLAMRQAGTLPNKIFLRSIRPIKKVLRAERRRRGTAFASKLSGGGGETFSFGAGFASIGGGQAKSFDFGAIKQGTQGETFNFGWKGRRTR